MKFWTTTIASLRKTAEERPLGYFQECMKRGQIEGDGPITDDTKISFTLRDHTELRQTFNPNAIIVLNPGCCGD